MAGTWLRLLWASRDSRQTAGERARTNVFSIETTVDKQSGRSSGVSQPSRNLVTMPHANSMVLEVRVFLRNVGRGSCADRLVDTRRRAGVVSWSKSGTMGS